MGVLFLWKHAFTYRLFLLFSLGAPRCRCNGRSIATCPSGRRAGSVRSCHRWAWGSDAFLQVLLLLAPIVGPASCPVASVLIPCWTVGKTTEVILTTIFSNRNQVYLIGNGNNPSSCRQKQNFHPQYNSDYTTTADTCLWWQREARATHNLKLKFKNCSPIPTEQNLHHVYHIQTRKYLELMIPFFQLLIWFLLVNLKNEV